MDGSSQCLPEKPSRSSPMYSGLPSLNYNILYNDINALGSVAASQTGFSNYQQREQQRTQVKRLTNRPKEALL